ncbi:hypothetical protein ABK675_07315 [Hafnia paralvei]|uniref:hypothetical protein n=1 Tax=Hafnia paralvei TaxID=546367 RepID=UPI0037516522
MFISTDILRAALCCVATENEQRTYLQGVYITPTHIKATNGRAAVMMEHGADTEIDAVFLVSGVIPDDAEGTLITQTNGEWYAAHMSDDETIIGYSELKLVAGRYPDFAKLLPEKPEPCTELPMFAAQLLALPYLMFRSGFGPVKFKPYGKTAPCQLILDPVTNHLYGNPFLVIMPLYDNAFELCAEVLNEI